MPLYVRHLYTRKNPPAASGDYHQYYLPDNQRFWFGSGIVMERSHQKNRRVVYRSALGTQWFADFAGNLCHYHDFTRRGDYHATVEPATKVAANTEENEYKHRVETDN
jgi:cation transport regulator ChaB